MHYLEDPRKELREIYFADLSWQPPELMRLWIWPLDFPNLGAIGHGLSIFLIFAQFWPNDTGQRWGSWTFSGDPSKEWIEIWHADIPWSP